MPLTNVCITALAVGCILSFFLGREYEYNKLKDTYLCQTDKNEDGQTVEKRFYYR